MTWGIITALIESPLCPVDCPTRRIDELMDDVNLEEMAELGYRLTGIYLSPRSILNPAMWVALVQERLPQEIKNLDPGVKNQQLLKEFQSEEDKTTQNTMFNFVKTYGCSLSEIVFNYGDLMFVNEGKDFLVDLSLASEWNTLDEMKLEKKFENTAQAKQWRMFKAATKSVCQGLTIAKAYLSSYHPVFTCSDSSACKERAKPICDQELSACKICTENTECEDKDETRPVCEKSGSEKGQCVATTCTSSPDCTDAAPVCDEEAKICKVCAKDNECTSSGKLLCMLSGYKKGRCVECKTTETCLDDAKPVCDAEECIACSKDSECSAKDSNYPACSTEAGANQGKCVACTANSFCTEAAEPICNIALATCKVCSTDIECAAKNPNKPICATGECVAS